MNRVPNALESQLAMRGQVVSGGSTPKATLFELALVRNFVARCLSTECYGEGVASGVTETEKDSNSDSRRRSLKPSRHRPDDSNHVAGELGP